MLGEVFHVDSVVLETTIGLHLGVLLPGPLGESVVLAHEDLLTAGELELGAPQSLDDVTLEQIHFEYQAFKQLVHIELTTIIC